MAIQNFFPIIFPTTGTNLEWPKMCIPNLFKPIWYKKTGRNLEWQKMGTLNICKPF